MVTFTVILDDPNFQTIHISTFCIIHIFAVGKRREFKSGVQVDRSKSQPMDDKFSLKGAWSRHMTH